MELVNEEISKYCEDFSKDNLEILNEIERQTNLKVLRPRMLSGFLQGKFLGFIVDMLKPKRILEIGTYTSYSAIAMANYLKEGSKITTIESNFELEEFIKHYIKKANFESIIELIIGNALEIIPSLNEKFDLIFLDADKYNYPKYLDLLNNCMNSGAYLITDNVLWSGKVISETKNGDFDTKGIKEFNEKVYESEDFDNIILPFRDGLNIIRKK